MKQTQDLVFPLMNLKEYEHYLAQLETFNKKTVGITITENFFDKCLREKYLLQNHGKPRITKEGLKRLGLTPHQYGLILDNKRQPSCYTVIQLSKLFTIPIDELVTYSFKPF